MLNGHSIMCSLWACQFTWIVIVQDELTLAGYRKYEEAKNAAPPLTDAENEIKMLTENEVQASLH